MEQKKPEDKIPFPKEQGESKTPGPKVDPQQNPQQELKEEDQKK